MLLLESTVQRHSACTQEDLLVLGQHSLTRLDLAPANSTQLSQESCRAQVLGSLQNRQGGHQVPGNPSSSYLPEMLLLIILPAPTSFQFLKCIPQSGTVPQTHIIPEESSHQILVLDTFLLLSRPQLISCMPIFFSSPTSKTPHEPSPKSSHFN